MDKTMYSCIMVKWHEHTVIKGATWGQSSSFTSGVLLLSQRGTKNPSMWGGAQVRVLIHENNTVKWERSLHKRKESQHTQVKKGAQARKKWWPTKDLNP